MSENVRQVIVMRKDLPMTAGKMIAQGSHASMKVLLDLMRIYQAPSQFPGGPDFLRLPLEGDVGAWLEGKFTKICVRVESEAELLAVYEKAKEAGLLCALIEDAGLTSFKGVPTKTCCAIGPASKEALDSITGQLRLL